MALALPSYSSPRPEGRIPLGVQTSFHRRRRLRYEISLSERQSGRRALVQVESWLIATTMKMDSSRAQKWTSAVGQAAMSALDRSFEFLQPSLRGTAIIARGIKGMREQNQENSSKPLSACSLLSSHKEEYP